MKIRVAEKRDIPRIIDLLKQIKVIHHNGRPDLFSDDETKTWRPALGDNEPELTITLSQKDMFDKVVMMENIVNGQHVEEYELYIDDGSGKFKKIGEGEVIGYKRIHKITPVEVARVKIKITSYRGNLEMQSVTLY